MRATLTHLLQLAALLCASTTVSALSASPTNDLLFQRNRPEILNLLNHPLQLQLATGDLPLGAFQRLVLDRKTILEGLELATQLGGLPGIIQPELELYEPESHEWLATAKQAGKTIAVPNLRCYTCGGNHLNLDCPEDQEVSSSAQALKSLLVSNRLEGATAVLQGYGFCCSTLLEACRTDALTTLDPVYHGWLMTHAERWSRIADLCAEQLPNPPNADGYQVCLSMLYNWIDGEAATTGIRADLNNGILSTMMNELERLEPGYAAQRDKHQSFVADLTGVKSAQARQEKAQSKVSKATAYLEAKKNQKDVPLNKAAAYLEAKNKKHAPLDKAAAYLEAKKKKEMDQ